MDATLTFPIDHQAVETRKSGKILKVTLETGPLIGALRISKPFEITIPNPTDDQIARFVEGNDVTLVVTAGPPAGGNTATTPTTPTTPTA